MNFIGKIYFCSIQVRNYIHLRVEMKSVFPNRVDFLLRIMQLIVEK